MSQRAAKSPMSTWSWSERLLHLSFGLLPYGSVLGTVGALGLLVFTVMLLKQQERCLWQPGPLRGQVYWLIAISGLMVLSSALAQVRGEAFLQLANYVPFFAFFLALQLLFSCQQREEPPAHLAQTVVLSSLPLSSLGLFEFGIKLLRQHPGVARPLLPWLVWVNTTEPHRAVSMFTHPNWFASYLILVLGLSLGLCLRAPFSSPTLVRRGIQLAVCLSFFGVLASGSRNAILVAILQVLVFGYYRLGKGLFWAVSSLGLLLLGVGIALLRQQLGGDRFSLQALSRDPRFGVWQIALSLIPEHPWLGWGLGGYKFLYPSRLIDPAYPYIAHPHNFWLMLAVEAGIPLLLLFSLFVGQICYRAMRRLISCRVTSDRLLTNESAVLGGYLLSFGGYCGFALFDVSLFDIRSNALAWLTLAVLSYLGRSKQSALS